ncbi:MAG TPA: hypothetical protein VFW48_07185, partial [Solirubrobacterales bacterium]|nr:hypothetical protein [Solirubrobacterales bacterium]
EAQLFKGSPPVVFYVKRTSCFQALKVFSHLLVDENAYCNPECEIVGWRCEARTEQGFFCAQRGKRIKAIPRRRV